jgi:geranylgeranyl diphosphate synthase, type I
VSTAYARVTMTAASFPDAERLRERVQQVLDEFLARQDKALAAVSPDLGSLMATVTELLRGGKRLRSAFCYWGWRGAGGVDDNRIVRVAGALEMFHAAALLHDDVMDGSDTRRGRPSAHRQLAELHRAQGWDGSPDAFGVAGAILAGDLCLSWSDEMFTGAGLPDDQLARGRGVFDRMRTELMAGQYLDMFEQVQPSTTVARARHVIRYKSAQYTVEQPLLLGGSLGGAPPELLAGYSTFGLALGEAFQLRDDVLGVFGDPTETGKPAGDDLREGKRTALVAAVLDGGDAQARETVRRLLGRAELSEREVGELTAVIVDTGALDHVEGLIARRLTEALAALDEAPVAQAAADALRELAVAATARAA